MTIGRVSWIALLWSFYTENFTQQPGEETSYQAHGRHLVSMYGAIRYTGRLSFLADIGIS